MKPLIIEETSSTPNIFLDIENNNFELSNRSLPEDAIGFYEPVMKWLEEYVKKPRKETEFNFKLEYFNTASSRQIIQLIIILSKIKKPNNLKINWYYREVDEDMESTGIEYSELIGVKFNFICIP